MPLVARGLGAGTGGPVFCAWRWELSVLSVVLPLADGEKGVHRHGKYVSRIRGWKGFWTSEVLPVVRLYSFASATSPSGLLPAVGSVWSVVSADLLSHHAQPQSGSGMLTGWMGGWVKISAAEASCPTQGHRTQLGPPVQPPRLSWNALIAPRSSPSPACAARTPVV